MSKKSKPLSPTNDTSNLVSIDSLAIEAKEFQAKQVVKKLEDDNLGLSLTVDKLLKELENKENQILHLEKMLGGQVPIIGDLSMPNEILIVEKQIALMHRNAKDRELTLDEAKRLDIYVKIKNGDKPKEDPNKNLSPLKDVTPRDLLKLAAKRIEE